MHEAGALQPFHRRAPRRTYPCHMCVYSHANQQFSQIWLFHPMAEMFGMSTWQVPFPTWQQIVPQVFFFFVFEDIFHFFGVSIPSSVP